MLTTIGGQESCDCRFHDPVLVDQNQDSSVDTRTEFPAEALNAGALQIKGEQNKS